MAQVNSSQVPSETVSGMTMNLIGEMLDQVVSLVFQAVITWALIKILPNLYSSFQKKKKSMFKARSQNSSDAVTGKCPAVLTKAPVSTGPPGLSLPEGLRPPSPVPCPLQ